MPWRPAATPCNFTPVFPTVSVSRIFLWGSCVTSKKLNPHLPQELTRASMKITSSVLW